MPVDPEQFDLEGASAYVDEMRGLAETELKATGSTITPSIIDQTAHEIALVRDGENYFKLKKLIDEQPSPLYTGTMEALGSVKRGLGNVASYAGEAIAQRTGSLRSEDSALPSFEVNLGPTFGAGMNVVEDVFGPALGTKPAVTTPSGAPVAYMDERPIPSNLRIGAEQLADAIEIGGPVVAEGVATATKRTNLGIVGRMALGSAGSEVAAEIVRATNRRLSKQPNSVVNLDSPGDVLAHLSKVASGGVLLGTADFGLSNSALKLQRKVYSKTLGLDTDISREQYNRLVRLGMDPSVAQVAQGTGQAVAASLSVFPITSRKAKDQARNVLEISGRTMKASLGDLAHHLESGVYIGDKSKRWFRQNDEYLQQVKEKAGDLYQAAAADTARAVEQNGLANAHIPFYQVRAEIEGPVLKRLAGGPLVGGRDNKFGFMNVAGSPGKKGDEFDRVINDVLNLPDVADIVEFRVLSNQVNDLSSKLRAAGDKRADVLDVVASKMKQAEENMVAPPELKASWAVARQEWASMNALVDEVTWKAFKRANSKFGQKNKFGAKSTLPEELVLQEVLGDKKISRSVVRTLHETAVAAEAPDEFKAAIQAHLKRQFSLATETVDKGPLSGLEVVKYSKLKSQLGLNDPDGELWQAHAEMIKRSGGNPDDVALLLDDIERAFPMGVPNPSQTAARRVGLAGIKSGLAFATLGGAVGGLSTRSAEGAEGGALSGITAAAVGLMALMGISEVMYNPSVLKKMRRVMNGNLSEQGAWRTMFNIASSVGMTRTFQNFLQAGLPDVDPMVDPRAVRRNEAAEGIRANANAAVRVTPFSPNPLIQSVDENATPVTSPTIGLPR